jgi:hypothetical protein
LPLATRTPAPPHGAGHGGSSARNGGGGSNRLPAALSAAAAAAAARLPWRQQPRSPRPPPRSRPPTPIAAAAAAPSTLTRTTPPSLRQCCPRARRLRPCGGCRRGRGLAAHVQLYRRPPESGRTRPNWPRGPPAPCRPLPKMLPDSERVGRAFATPATPTPTAPAPSTPLTLTRPRHLATFIPNPPPPDSSGRVCVPGVTPWTPCRPLSTLLLSHHLCPVSAHHTLNPHRPGQTPPHMFAPSRPRSPRPGVGPSRPSKNPPPLLPR